MTDGLIGEALLNQKLITGSIDKSFKYVKFSYPLAFYPLDYLRYPQDLDF